MSSSIVWTRCGNNGHHLRRTTLIDVGGVFLETLLLTLLSVAGIVMGHPLIAMAAVLCMLSAITQLLPFPHSDGYWIVSDTFGIESLGRDSYLWTKRMVCDGMGIGWQGGESITTPTGAVVFYVMFLALCSSAIFVSFIAEVIHEIMAPGAYVFLIGHVSDFHTLHSLAHLCSIFLWLIVLLGTVLRLSVFGVKWMFTIFCAVPSQRAARLVWVALACLLAAHAFAQDRPDSQKSADFRVSTDNVVLDVLIHSPNTGEVTLQKEDLELFVDGQRRSIESCIPARSKLVPLNIFLVVDRSRAISSMVASLPTVLGDALDRLPSEDRIAVVSGAAYPHIGSELLTPLTVDRAKARDALTRLAEGYKQHPGNLIGGLYESMTNLHEIVPFLPKDSQAGQTVVVVLSDDSGATPRKSTHGWRPPPEAIYTYNSVSAAFEERNVAVNLLLPFGNIGSQAMRNDSRLTYPLFSIMGLKLNPLESLAKETGGFTVRVGRDNLLQSFDDLIAEMSGRYVVAFTPPDKDGKLHKVRLVLTKSARQRLGQSRITTRYAFRAPAAIEP